MVLFFTDICVLLEMRKHPSHARAVMGTSLGNAMCRILKTTLEVWLINLLENELVTGLALSQGTGFAGLWTQVAFASKSSTSQASFLHIKLTSLLLLEQFPKLSGCLVPKVQIS